MSWRQYLTFSTTMSFMTLILCHRTSSVADVETSYFTQLKMCYVMTTFRCPSDILIMSWLFTARCSTWPGNHLVPCVAELVGSCIQIHACRCHPYPSNLSLCLPVDHFCLFPVDDKVISRSRAPSTCKQSRRNQDARRTLKHSSEIRNLYNLYTCIFTII